MTGILVDAALKATAVLALALLLDRSLRRASAADRHLVWTMAAGAVLVLPLLSATVPSVRWPAVPVAWVGFPGGETASRTAGGTDARPERLSSAAAGRTLDWQVEETVVRVGREVAAGVAADPSTVPTSRDARSGRPIGAAVVSAGERADGAGSRPGLPWPLLAWGLGAAAVLGRLLVQAAGCVRAGWRARPFGPGRVRRVARDVADDLGLRRLPRLLRGPAGAMPSTWGLVRRRLLLPEEAAGWSHERLRTVLAHELAHLRRRDGPAQLVAAAACAVYWFHPLAWVAARRMATERELACDDEVLALGARPSGYARCLVELAREARGRTLAGAVATSVAHRGGLGRRVDALLADDRPRSGLSGRRAAVFGVAGALLLLPLASLQPLARAQAADPVREPRPGDGAVFRYPGPAAEARQEADPCWAPDVSHSINVHRSDDEHRLRWEGPGCVSEILVRGTPTFDADFDRITGWSAGGLVRIEERAGGVRRALEIRPDGDDVVRTFRRDGRPAEPGEEDRAWIGSRVVTLLRQTGIAAGERVAWILSREGPDGVFREVDRMTADRGQALYLGELLDRAELDDAALRRLLATAGDAIGSDGRLAGLLERVAAAEADRVAGSHRAAFRDAAGTVGSDGDLRRALTRLVEVADGDPPLAALALEIAADGIGSDGDMAVLLVAVARTAAGALADPDLRERYLRALDTVGSDGDELVARRALERAVRGQG